MRRLVTVALLSVLLVATAGVAVGTPADGTAETGGESTPQQAAVEQSGDACAPLASDPRENPANDTLGWEDGCWANETLGLTFDDGLNETEQAAYVARTMARVEQVRDEEFTIDVSVRTRSVESYLRLVNYDEVGVDRRLRANTKYEALLMLGETESYFERQESNLNGSLGGFYFQNSITIITRNTSAPKMAEGVLAHELVHALQDQNRWFPRETTLDNSRAVTSIIEGDANTVEHHYLDRCEAEWECWQPNRTYSKTGGRDLHWGMFFIDFFPYSDGAGFVDQYRQQYGWEGVNGLYERPPVSTEQVIHPEKYRTDVPETETFVADESTEEWRRVTRNSLTLGEAALASMFVYPAWESDSEGEVMSKEAFIERTDSGDVSSLDPYNYSTRWSSGWDGDAFVVYANDTSVESNETAYVWKTYWDSETEAEEFADGYRQLLDAWGGEPVSESASVWRIPDGQFADAFAVNQNGTTVVVVNAPTVDALKEVHSSPTTNVTTATPTPTPTATPTSTPTVTPTAVSETVTSAAPDTAANPAGETATTESGPGFGSLTVLLAVAVLAIGVLWVRGQ